ncbi:hypothetical protein IF2G_10923 [Cordyceps javanica]|nr:hypothetical protein IF2G_10923 [Cordyceps javanica]
MVFGPTLGKSLSASLELPQQLLNGSMPAISDLHLCIADVRDVAELHILAMETRKAAGQRYAALSDERSISVKELATILKTSLSPQDAKKVPSMAAPNFLLRIVGIFDKKTRVFVPELRAWKGPTCV